MALVKFDTDKLPPILNALETMNGDQKLILEVAVCQHANHNNTPTATDERNSNIWERMSSEQLLWMVSIPGSSSATEIDASCK